MIEAKVICDSISPQMKRLTTFQLRYPKFIHGELMTHRVISRNASSSRAIPTTKLIEEVRSDALRAAPVFWGKNRKGMQAQEELTGEQLEIVKAGWTYAALAASDWAEKMTRYGAHKQIVNRLLEPFSHINVVATATEWDNFFGLRLHKDAQPEMRALAMAMWEALNASTPRELKPGEWHLPFITVAMEVPVSTSRSIHLIKVSVARCARVSYLSHETGKRSDIEEDLELYEKLVGSHPMHASPAEHQATPDDEERGPVVPGEEPKWVNLMQHGNFVGWRQYRKMLGGEACAPIPDEFLPF